MGEYDLDYVIKMINVIVIAFTALVLSLLGFFGAAVVENVVWSDVFLLVFFAFGGGVVGCAAVLVSKVDFKRGDNK